MAIRSYAKQPNRSMSKTTGHFLTSSQNWWGNKSDGALDVGANAQNYSVPCSTDDWVKVLNLSYLRIRNGYTMTMAARCRGLAIYVDGDCLIEGVLSMTARGSYTPNIMSEVGANGLRLVRRKTGQTQTLAGSDVTGAGSALVAAEASQQGINTDGKIYTFPRIGGSFGAGSGTNGVNGYDGGTSVISCGGGGGGAKNGTMGWPGGSGASGTCFSGGGGGGSGAGGSGSPATSYGGPGGAAPVYSPGGCPASGGGAGNPGGGGTLGKGAGNYGQDGTGGLLLLFVRGSLIVASTGVISSNGSMGGSYSSQIVYSGGGSGGGVVMCLYGGLYSNAGSIIANGGACGLAPNGTRGGNGGAGHVLVEQIDV